MDRVKFTLFHAMLSWNSLFYLRTVLPENTRKIGVWIFFKILTKTLTVRSPLFIVSVHVEIVHYFTLFFAMLSWIRQHYVRTVSPVSLRQTGVGILTKTLTALPHSSTSKSTVNANVSKECWALKGVDVKKKKKKVRFFLFCRRCSTHISFSPLRYVLIKVLIGGWIFLLRKYLLCVMFPPPCHTVRRTQPLPTDSKTVTELGNEKTTLIYFQFLISLLHFC